MKLDYQIVEVKDLDNQQRDIMFNLMQRHYDNMKREEFERDLHEKNWVILLFSESGELEGFSTQMLIRADNQEVYADRIVIYSGDTIIAQEYWGSTALPIAQMNLVYRIRAMHPGKRIFWLLISKGLRTYKFTQVLFLEHYPNHLTETPPETKVFMDYLGRLKFGDRYDASRNIVLAENDGQFLKTEFHPDNSRRNAVADFYYSRNPGYVKGDELLCLTEVCDSNLHPYYFRMLKAHE